MSLHHHDETMHVILTALDAISVLIGTTLTGT